MSNRKKFKLTLSVEDEQGNVEAFTTRDIKAIWSPALHEDLKSFASIDAEKELEYILVDMLKQTFNNQAGDMFREVISKFDAEK